MTISDRCWLEDCLSAIKDDVFESNGCSRRPSDDSLSHTVWCVAIFKLDYNVGLLLYPDGTLQSMCNREQYGQNFQEELNLHQSLNRSNLGYKSSLASIHSHSGARCAQNMLGRGEKTHLFNVLSFLRHIHNKRVA